MWFFLLRVSFYIPLLSLKFWQRTICYPGCQEKRSSNEGKRPFKGHFPFRDFIIPPRRIGERISGREKFEFFSKKHRIASRNKKAAGFTDSFFRIKKITFLRGLGQRHGGLVPGILVVHRRSMLPARHLPEYPRNSGTTAP